MINKHLTDEEIQEYAIDKTKCDFKLGEHLHVCEDCKEKVSAYRLLFNALKQQPDPSFDFNLSESVISKLTPYKPKPSTNNLFLILSSIFAILILGIVSFIYRDSLISMFAGLAPLMIYLILISAVTISIFLVTDKYKLYKKKMNTLDFY
jgi:hypothetical protein